MPGDRPDGDPDEVVELRLAPRVVEWADAPPPCHACGQPAPFKCGCGRACCLAHFRVRVTLVDGRSVHDHSCHVCPGK